MNTVVQVGVALLSLLACFGSAWYIAFRLRTTLGLQRRWLLRVLVIAALVGSFMLMVSATKSADVVLPVVDMNVRLPFNVIWKKVGTPLEK